MSKDEWRVVRKITRPRRSSSIWIITRTKNEKKQMGYFKIPNRNRKGKKYTGPVLLANELISYRLAKVLNLNVAEIKLAKIQGRQGVISIVQSVQPLYTWKQLNNILNDQIIKYIDDPEQLLKTFVFDIWICNLDRHGDNLITFPIGNKYSFYLIDHGRALLGAMKLRRVPWNSSYWNHVAKYNRHYVQGLRSYISSYEQLSPFVEQIQSVPAHKIKKIVNSVPTSILPNNKKNIVIKLILSRQKNLHVIVKRWIKEYKSGYIQ
jgi:hypothetical protein